MSRRMDSHVQLIAEYKDIQDRYKELGKEFRALEKQEKAKRNEIIRLMKNSSVAEIGGELVFELVPGSRRTVTLERVYQFAPHLADVLIEQIEWFSVKFFDN